MSSDTFRTLDEADVRGKRVLVRVDLNVPVENGKIADTTRIERVAPTIREIADKGGKVILLSHFGRPKGPDPAQSLKLLTPAIAAVLKRPVAFAEDCIGERAAAAVNAVVAAIRHPMAGDTSRRARRSTSTCFRNSIRRRSPISGFSKLPASGSASRPATPSWRFSKRRRLRSRIGCRNPGPVSD